MAISGLEQPYGQCPNGPAAGVYYAGASNSIKRAKLSPGDRLLRKHNVVDNNGNVQDTMLVLNYLFETVKDSIVADLQEVEALAKAEK